VPAKKLFSGPEDRRIKRALCIVAHPDDIEYYCGGTVLKMTARGVMVEIVLTTSGDKGTRNPNFERGELARKREQEQEAAAYILGVKRVSFLRHGDAELMESLELREEFVRLTFDPNGGYRYHPDHRIVGRVALDAAWPCARDPLTYPDAGAPHETAEAWCFAGVQPNLEVDVGDVIEDKIEARLAHASQTRYPPALRRRWNATARIERFHQVDLR
jgi:LmbE family N-acetylglucosaminyl deacetylase